ncbi:hypothetical protein NMG60_11032160 [Bertholletia excelsa]
MFSSCMQGWRRLFAALFDVRPTWITQCPLPLLGTRMPYGSLPIGCEEHLDPAGTGSFYNEGEANIIVQHVLSLIYAEKEILIIGKYMIFFVEVSILFLFTGEIAVATVGLVMLFRGGIQMITAAGATTSSACLPHPSNC